MLYMHVKKMLQCSMIYFNQCTNHSPLKVPIMNRKQVSFRIEPDIIKRLKFIALEQDRSLTDLFLEAIKEILKKYEKKAK